ncbi:MAG TPA: SDR family oxidoreductase [Atribacteraceae bacterium]|nr:SDR family oxidoreductase [Atribacteraceae bacterium]
MFNHKEDLQPWQKKKIQEEEEEIRNQPLLVVGGTGRTGRLLVRKLSARGYSIRLLTRNPKKAQMYFKKTFPAFSGNLNNVDTLIKAVRGVRAVLCTAGSPHYGGPDGPKYVDYLGVANLVEVSREFQVGHFVLVSSLGVTKPFHSLNLFGKVLKWKRKGEEALLASGLSYTIVRPGGLLDDQGGFSELVFSQGDRVDGMISREDVAEVCIQSLWQPGARNITFEVVGTDEPRVSDWETLFGSLAEDAPQ